MAAENSGRIQLDDHGIRAERDLLTSRIVGLFLESLLFGIFAIIYSYGTWALLHGDRPRSMRNSNLLLVAVNTLMVSLALANLCLTLDDNLYGFVTKGMDHDTTYEALFDYSPSSGRDNARFYIYVTQTLIGDGFMIYRLFVVWDGRRVVLIVPSIFVLADAVAGYGLIPFGFYRGIVLPIMFFAVSFCTNMYSTIFIMWRVLRSRSQIQGHWEWHSRTWFNLIKYRRVLEAIIQSAGIYSAASIALLVTLILSPNVGHALSQNVLSPLIGIVFAMIVVHIAHNSAACVQGSRITLESNSSVLGSGRKELHVASE